MSYPFPSWRRLAGVALVAALILGLGPLSGPASAQTDAQVVFIHTYANGPGQNPVAVCFVGPETVLVDPVVSGDAIEEVLTPGDYTVSVYSTFDGDCASAANTPDAQILLSFPADSSTAVAVWPALSTFEMLIGSTDHDLSCLDPGSTRLMASNLANIEPVDLRYDTTALPDIANGGVLDAVVATGTYDFEWVRASDDTNVGVPPFSLALPDTTLTHVILAGGLGSAVPVYWTFNYDLPVEECVQPTTTVAPPTVPTTTLAPVSAVTPAFTG